MIFKEILYDLQDCQNDQQENNKLITPSSNDNCCNDYFVSIEYAICYILSFFVFVYSLHELNSKSPQKQPPVAFAITQSLHTQEK